MRMQAPRKKYSVSWKSIVSNTNTNILYIRYIRIACVKKNLI